MEKKRPSSSSFAAPPQREKYRGAGVNEADKMTDGLGGSDHYQFGFVNLPNYDHDLQFEMSGSDVLIGLRLGFDVIFVGNWPATADDPLLAKWFSAHPKENYLFYLDASLNETLKRHETKSHPRISADKMKEVYPYASPTGHENEVIIPESSSLEQTVEQIAQIMGI